MAQAYQLGQSLLPLFDQLTVDGRLPTRVDRRLQNGVISALDRRLELFGRLLRCLGGGTIEVQ